MASIRNLYKDPFENYNLLMQKLNRMAYIGEATSAVAKMSGLSSMRNFNSMNSALGILQQRMDTFANTEMNLFSAMDTVAQRLIEFNKYQPQILSVLERVCEYDDRLMLALQRSNSIISRLDSNFIESISQISVGEAFEYIDGLQATLPELTSVVENNEADEISVKSENEISKDRKKFDKDDIKSCLQYIELIVQIVQILFSVIFSNTPEININVNIANDYSTNYYIQKVNNTYVYNYGISPYEYNDCGFRFVSKAEIIVRIKPDCSSTVVEKLKLGKFVQIVDKYKKWVQIRWKNEDGTYSFGWVQNYKLSEFKE